MLLHEETNNCRQEVCIVRQAFVVLLRRYGPIILDGSCVGLTKQRLDLRPIVGRRRRRRRRLHFLRAIVHVCHHSHHPVFPIIWILTPCEK